MKLKRLSTCLCIAFVGTFLIPLVQRIFKIIPEMELGGVTNTNTVTELSFQTLMSGQFTESVSNWYAEQFGFRNTLVRVENQINYSLFHDFPRLYDDTVVLGRQKWLFQKKLIINNGPSEWLPDEKIEQVTAQLKKLQDYMDSKGVPLILVIAPMKSSVYPEMVPDYYKTYEKPPSETYWMRMKTWLDKRNIRYYDSIAKARQLRRGEAPFLLSPPDGTHWTYAFAAWCTREITEILNPHMATPFPDFSFDYTTSQGEAIHTEKDLRGVTNILWSANADAIFSYPIAHLNAPTTKKPSIVIVGDSFSNTIVPGITGFFGGERVVENVALYYYFNTFSPTLGQPRQPFDRNAFDLDVDIIQRYDALMLVTSEAALFELGFGFIDVALNSL